MNATATSVPGRETCARRWLGIGSEIVAASEIAPATTSTAAPIASTAATARHGRIRAVDASDQPPSAPAGTQASARRARGWSSLPASCWSGSAPRTLGPNASAPTSLSTYSQPTAAKTAPTATSHATNR